MNVTELSQHGLKQGGFSTAARSPKNHVLPAPHADGAGIDECPEGAIFSSA
jgi:hypothetical protein